MYLVPAFRIAGLITGANSRPGIRERTLGAGESDGGMRDPRGGDSETAAIIVRLRSRLRLRHGGDRRRLLRTVAGHPHPAPVLADLLRRVRPPARRRDRRFQVSRGRLVQIVRERLDLPRRLPQLALQVYLCASSEWITIFDERVLSR